MFRTLAFVASSVVAVQGQDHWAVLVAGSNSFWNYRHQADVCHAYHVLTARGFHPDNIITMMYDDVAGSSQNPFPGKLYNYPFKTMVEAVDVYGGCKIDYRGKDVSPEKFLAVLTGSQDKAGGKVLKSKSEDHVFVNFVDHGAVGLIAFPEGLPPGQDVLHARQLISTLKEMHSKGMYKQLTFYLETCESGSMFQGLLPKFLPVYAVTAASAKESSWGTYCGNDAVVGGKMVGSCLGDLFSVNWMEDSDKTIGSNETLQGQFEAVQKLTSKSHVMQFGQLKHIGNELVSDFQGSESLTSVGSVASKPRGASHASAVDSRDVKIHHLYHAYLTEGTLEASEELIKEIKARQAAKELDSNLRLSLGFAGEQVGDDIAWTDEVLECHQHAVEMFGITCGWRETHLPLSKTLYKLCVQSWGDGAAVSAAVGRTCAPAVADIWA